MVMREKIVVPCLDVMMIAFFPRNIQRKTLFLIPNLFLIPFNERSFPSSVLTFDFIRMVDRN